ncbi:class I adenylate-forming enzyme family protein [Paenibacillus medicaginis]|uniref:Class I adenylate-forming enzyme family protein n=1 Tax=Paenibacillus medicaginis TaxID=1470560 RepID=A0ABV5CB71_9BACL
MIIKNQAKELYSFLISSYLNSENPFILYGTERILYAELHDEIEKLSKYLEVNGISEGDLIAVKLPSSYTLIYMLLALWKQGASVFLMDTRLKQNEVELLFERVRPKFFIKNEDLLSIGSISKLDILIERISKPAHIVEAPLLLSTSGSTGHPKIVGRSFESIYKEIIRYTASPNSVKTEDVVMILSPITFSYGVMSALLPSLYMGASIVLPTIRTKDIVSNIKTHKVSMIYGVPYHYMLLLATSDGDIKDFSSLRACISAGERLNEDIHEQFENKFGIRIGQLYGMTELGLIAVDLEGKSKNSVGVPLLPIKIEENQIFVEQQHSPYLFTQAESLYVKPWLKTGDVGDLDESGLYIRGRTDSLIIKAGIKFYLSEVEEIMRRSDYIKEVVLTEESSTKDIIAYVETKGDISPEEIVKYCKGNISSHKLPRKIMIIPSMPRTMSGKLDKKQLTKVVAREIILL